MDFALILVVAVAVCGGIWLLDLVWRVTRQTVLGVSSVGRGGGGTRWIVDYARAFFPILLIVLVLRSFVVEPFRIPSGSMLPTLQNGDFILVKKYQYGLRLPITNKKLVDTGEPRRGDVMVFKFPRDDAVNFIKRVVGLPGDRVTYDEKRLYVNGREVKQSFVEESTLTRASRKPVKVSVFSEELGAAPHRIQIDDGKRIHTDYDMEITVPENHYFVLGDNRDYSNDSRFWGFVPEENVVGQAFLIWFSWDSDGSSGVNWDRIADTIE